MKRTFYSRFALPILVLVAFLSPLILGGARRALMTNHNDVKEWLPAGYQETVDFNWFLKHFAGQQFVMISWEGCTIDDTRLDTFVKKLTHVEPGEVKICQEVITGKALLDRLQSDPTRLEAAEAFKRLEGLLIGPDHKQTCAVITLTEAARKLLNEPASPLKPLTEIKRIAIEECAVPAATIHMGGPPVDNVALDEAGQQSLFRLAGLAGVIGLAVSWWCLRSPRLVIMVFMAGLMSAAASLAIVWYTGHSVNAITLTMPSLVYVAAISAAIHLANFYRETVYEEGVEGAPTRALSHAALPLSLATGTTAAGLVTLAYSELVPIQQFGVFSAAGVVAATLILVLYLPSTLELFPLRPKRGGDDKPVDDVKNPLDYGFWKKAAEWVIGHPYQAGLGSLVVMGACAWGTTAIQTSVQLMRLFPPGAKIIHDYAWLEKNLGPLVPMEVVLRFPKDCELDAVGRLQLIDLVQRRVEGIDVVGNAMSAVTFAPNLGKQQETAKGIVAASKEKFGLGGRSQTVLRRKTLNKRLESNRQQFIDNDYLSVEEEDETDLWRISARVAALEDVDYGLFVGQLRDRVDPILAEYNGTVGNDPKKQVTAVYTGLVPLVYKAQRSLLEGLIFGFVTDVALVVVVLMIAVRDWSAGLIMLFPAIFPCAVVFGLMGWTGTIVDIGTVMTPAVALGVTIDDVVHFMLRHRSALAEGATRKEAIMSAYRGCAQAMYQSWGVIGLGLSVFALSPFTPTQRFGMMMITLLSAALVGNLVLLPAILASPVGALFGRGLVKRLQRERQALVKAEGTAHDGADSPAKKVTTRPVSSVHTAHESIERHVRF
ncbi:MAG: MMPL family transporter [Pirellulales bacterium]|nr:MMPL family transporter [Pirellulales bacterium]